MDGNAPNPVSSSVHSDMISQSNLELSPDHFVGGDDAISNEPQTSYAVLKSVNSVNVETPSSVDMSLMELSETNYLKEITEGTSLEHCGSMPSHEEVVSLLALNSAYCELVDNIIDRVSRAIQINREKQQVLKARLKRNSDIGPANMVKKVPLRLFFPPYFRDMYGMSAPANAETRQRLEDRVYDHLIRTERKWMPKELETLHRAVRESVLEIKNRPFQTKRALYLEKIRTSGQETANNMREEWQGVVDQMDRLIAYHRNLPDKELFTCDWKDIDWMKIATTDFRGTRSPAQVRLKWINEQLPQWSKKPWTEEETNRLRELVKDAWIDWDVIAEKLGTNRTPFQCFVKCKRDLCKGLTGVRWNKEEDSHLMALVHSLTVNGTVPWDKIGQFMVPRSSQQCQTRYRRTLNTELNHGRWTEEEDLMLMCAVGRYGTKDWLKVSSYVKTRSDGQCRERWVDVLDKKNKDEKFSLEEDEILLTAVKKLGRVWSKIAKLLPGRTPAHCKLHYRALVNRKLKLCSTGNFAEGNIPSFDMRKRRRQKVEEIFKQMLAADGKDEVAEKVTEKFIEDIVSDEKRSDSDLVELRDQPGPSSTVNESLPNRSTEASSSDSRENSTTKLHRLLHEKLEVKAQDINLLAKKGLFRTVNLGRVKKQSSRAKLARKTVPVSVTKDVSSEE